MKKRSKKLLSIKAEYIFASRRIRNIHRGEYDEVYFNAEFGAVPDHGSASAQAKTLLLESSAAGGTGAVYINGVTLPLGTIAGISGTTAHGPYSVNTSVPALMQTVYLPGAKGKLPGVSIGLTNLMAAASGTASGTPMSQGQVTMEQAAISVVPGPKVTGSPYLTVAIENADGASAYVPGGSPNGTAYGSTGLGQVVVTGSLLNGNQFMAPVNAPFNTVLYNAGGISVTVNAVTPVTPAGCAKNCTLPPGIETDAVLITFTNAIIDGQTFSGSLAVGDTVSN